MSTINQETYDDDDHDHDHVLLNQTKYLKNIDYCKKNSSLKCETFKSLISNLNDLFNDDDNDL